jgi:hypothetical protein
MPTISFRNKEFPIRRSIVPQLWLFNWATERERQADFVLPLDRTGREQLLTLMATAIETLHRHQVQGEMDDEQFSILDQDQGTAPTAEGDRLPQAVVTETGRGEPGESTPSVCDGGAG